MTNTHTLYLPAQQIADFMSRIYEVGLTTPSGGNLSIKDEEGNVWLTPSQVDKGRLSAEDIVKIGPDGIVEGKHPPTSEYPFHLAIYKARPDIRAVVHAHPPSLVAFSASGARLDLDLFPLLALGIKGLGYTPYVIPGSLKLGEVVSAGFAEGHDAIIMENHGIICTGNDLAEAFHRLENLEMLARVQVQVTALGKFITITDKNIQRLLENDTSHEFPEISNEMLPQAENLLDYAQRAYHRGLGTSNTFLWSFRWDEHYFIFTPPGKDIMQLRGNDFRFASIHEISTINISLLLEIHKKIYKAHPGITSICLAQPQSLMAFAVGVKNFNSRTIPESYIFLQDVGSITLEEMCEDVEFPSRCIRKTSPCQIIQNLGFLVTGTSAFQVFDRLEVAEFTARSILETSVLGGMKPIQQTDIDDIINTYL